MKNPAQTEMCRCGHTFAQHRNSYGIEGKNFCWQCDCYQWRWPLIKWDLRDGHAAHAAFRLCRAFGWIWFEEVQP